MKSYQLVQLLVLSLFFNVLSAQATSLDTSLMAGDFLKDNKILEGRWFGGKNFTGNLCRSFYSFRVGARGYIDKVEMNLGVDNEMDVYGSLSNAHAKVEGEYLGDYSACQNATGWLGIGVDKIEATTHLMTHTLYRHSLGEPLALGMKEWWKAFQKKYALAGEIESMPAEITVEAKQPAPKVPPAPPKPRRAAAFI